MCDGERPCGTCTTLDSTSTCWGGQLSIRCNSCASLHRSCDYNKPTCRRCSIRGIECTRDEKSKLGTRPRKEDGAVSDNPAGADLPSDDEATNTINETKRSREEASTGGGTRQSIMMTGSQSPTTPTFDQTVIRDDLSGLCGWRDPVTGADDLGSAEGIARYF